MELAEVIPLRPRAVSEDAPLRRLRRPYVFCQHRDMTMDPQSERVHCDDCGLEITPFNALQILCNDYDRHLRARDAAIEESHKAAAQLADLKRQVRNAQAQLRRVAR